MIKVIVLLSAQGDANEVINAPRSERGYKLLPQFRLLEINDGNDIGRKACRDPRLLNIPSHLEYISLALKTLDVRTITYIPDV